VDVLLIVNEKAGNGKGKKVWESISSSLSFKYNYAITQYNGHAIELARQAGVRSQQSSRELLVVAIGGDGTIHEVITGIAGMRHVTVGSMKAGSGNDFARGFLSFKQTLDILRYIEQRRRVRKTKLAVGDRRGRKISKPYNARLPMDLGALQLDNEDTGYFVNNAGIGFDAYITTQVNRSALKPFLNRIKLGSFAYALTVIWALFTFTRFGVTVSDGKKSWQYDDVWFIAMCNQPYFGGGMKISPHSNTSDGEMELTIVHRLARWKLLLVFVTVFWGGHTGFKEVTMLRGRSFSLQVDRETVCHTDGEFFGQAAPGKTIHCAMMSKKWYNIASSNRIIPVAEDAFFSIWNPVLQAMR